MPVQVEAPPAAAPAWTPLRPGLLERDEDGRIWLLGNRCRTCQTTYFPAHNLCIRCLTPEQLEPVRLSRRGSIYTFSVVYQSTPEFPTPYVLAYVDLPEGVRVLAQVTGLAPEAARTGMAVELVEAPTGRADSGAEVIGYRFRPVEEREP